MIAGGADAESPPIAAYGLIGDGRTTALISSAGSIDWLCLPNLGDESIFAAILDRSRGGHFSIACVDGAASQRRYRGLSNILETDYAGPHGRFRVVDFMPIDPSSRHVLAPERELVRILEPLQGAPEVRIAYAPAPSYGRRRPALRRHGASTWTFRAHRGLFVFRSTLDMQADENGGLCAHAVLKEPAVLSLSFSSLAPAVLPGFDASRKRLRQTASWWQSWAEQCTYRGCYRDLVLRSALVLKLLQFSLSGAMIAAPTTSLPEAIGGTRNWDYRFCWLRDSSFILRAFVDLGFWQEGKAFFDWFMHSTRSTQPDLRPLYDEFGRIGSKERELDHLAGYRGSRPVRIGNAASKQYQLDTFGAVVGAARDFVARGHTLDERERRLLYRLGRLVCRRWREPDNGIWELRSGPLHNTYSKAMAWSALNDLIWFAENGHTLHKVEPFKRERDALKAAILSRGVSADGVRFKGAFDKDYLDAALLLLPRYGFIDAHAPIMRNTAQAIMEKLEDGDMIRRYSDGLDNEQGREGVFIVCNFWLVEYLARSGDLGEATRRFERLAGRANDLGLLSEEWDPQASQMLGNFPQAFSHTGLISAALALEEARSRAAGSAQ